MCTTGRFRAWAGLGLLVLGLSAAGVAAAPPQLRPMPPRPTPPAMNFAPRTFNRPVVPYYNYSAALPLYNAYYGTGLAGYPYAYGTVTQTFGYSGFPFPAGYSANYQAAYYGLTPGLYNPYLNPFPVYSPFYANPYVSPFAVNPYLWP